MPNPLERWKAYGLVAAYEVAKTVEVVIGENTYRIEVLKSYSNPNVPFTTRALIQEEVILTPAFPEGAKQEPMEVWVDYDLPWTEGADADSALAQALGFLGDQTKR